MKSITLIVQALILLGLGLKMSFWQKRVGIFIACLCLLFSLGILHWTVEIPQNRITDWMHDYHSRQDIAVCLMLDVAFQISFCLMAVRIKYGSSLSKAGRWCYRILLSYPSLMIFGIIFLLQVELIGCFPGQSFWVTALMEGAFFMLILLLLWKGFTLLLPQADNRLELLFFIEVMTGILGILSTVCGNQPL